MPLSPRHARRSPAATSSVALLAMLASVLGVLPPAPASAAATPPLSVKVNFQPDATAVPAGFAKDTGAAYSDAAGSGWVRQDSLSGTHVPFGVPLNTRDRSTCTALTTQQRTFIHMQAPVTNTTNNATPVAWEYALPNGSYQVTVGVGDANLGNDAESHTINVEGVNAVRAFPRSTAVNCTPSRLTTGTVTATVTDGRLTVDALTGTNTKLQYVTIDNAPAAVTGLTATPAAGAVDLDWDDTAEAASFRVFRSSNLPVATTGTPFATTTGSAHSDPTAVKGTIYHYAVQAVTAAGIVSPAVTVGAMIDDAAPIVPAMPVKVNFNRANGTAVAGYVLDHGQNFANTRGYGWVVPGSATPLNLNINGRERGEAGLDKRLDTLMHMQYPPAASPANGISSPGAWELAVADGSYDVELAVGDQSPGTDATSHEINVEGRKAVDDFAVTSTTTGAARFTTATVSGVAVTDGRLTVDAIGGTNTKIDYIVVTPTPADAPPAAPTGLTATAGDASVALDWADNGDSDLGGYDVFRGTGATVATTGTPLNGATPVAASTYTDSTAVNGTTYRYAVVAVDQAGQRSASSASVTATPDRATPVVTDLPLKVNFQDEAPAAPEGWTKDFGSAYSNARGHGWVVPGSSTPLSLVGNGRTRAVRAGNDATLLQRTLVHMQGNDVPNFTGVRAPGAWELAVPDGRYAVTVSVGDQPGSATATCVDPCYDSKHSVVVEGTAAVTRFQATATEEFKQATVSVVVADGKLTVDATGGTNTKINYIEVATADVTAPPAPNDLVAIPGDGFVELSWDAVPAADLAGYAVYRSTEDNVALTDANRLTAAPQTARTFTDSTAQNGTTYRYVVTAVDQVGNESAASSTVSATPADTTAPAAPQDVRAVAGQEQVSLDWTAITGSDVVAYRVYRSTSSPVAAGPATRVASTTAATYLDEQRAAGIEAFYVVTAVDEAGNESVASAEVSATPTEVPDTTAPAAPADLKAVAGDGQVSLTWTAGTEQDLRGYRVYRSAAAGSAGTALTTEPLTAPSYVDTTAVNGTAYFYVVRAVDVAGNESAASSEVSAEPADTTAPAAPAGVTATAGVQSVTVTWTANAESDLQGYRVYRSTGSTVEITSANLVSSLPSGTHTFADTGLDAGTKYAYVVVALDAAGNASAPSATVSATPTAPRDETPPAAPTGLTATVDGAEVDLSWTAPSATDLAGYTVYRSETATGPRTKISGALLTAPSYTDTTAPAGATSHYVVTASDASGNESAASSSASADVPAPAVDLKVNFQTDAAPVPAGYTKDTGAAYSAARGSGWVREDSLSTATRTPLDLTANARLRTRAGIDPRLNTLVHMHYGDITPPGTNGVPTPGAWERNVPNGRYTVTVSVGDEPGAAKTGCPAPCYDSLHTIHVEGVTAVDAFQATAAAEFKSGTVTVDVTDGKLTLDALGSTNTKINYVDVKSVGPVVPDTTAPGAPAALTATGGDASATLSWSAPADLDVAGYHVYRSTTPTVTATAGARVNTSLVSGTSFSDATVANGTRYWYAVTAVDTAGNESVLSGARDVTPAPVTGYSVKVDFQDEATIPPTGYLRDWGQAYGARTSTNQGTGNSYGWVNVGSSTPLSLVGNGRNRNTEATPANQPDLRLATFLHMQYAGGTNGVTVPGSWELAVPNGAYTVTAALGDAGTAVDSSHWLNIENQNAVAAFAPTAATKFATATRTVVVADGRLTLSPAGGTNTKLAYVDVASLDRGNRPYTAAVTPGNGATGVVTNAAPTADNQLTAAVDGTTLASSVTLTRVADGVKVPGTGSTSGGGDTVSFKADAVLAAGTLYRFDITAGAKDTAGNAFLPFSSVFTTASGGGSEQPPGTTTAAFDKIDSGAAKGGAYTSLVVGPDGKLYAGSIFGQITRWTINPDGTLSGAQVINTVRTHATARGWEGAPNRTVIGLAFDPASTPSNPILWITDNYAYLGADVPDATGAIAKLTGPDLEDYQEVVVNLPRSIKDHETNSIAWKNGKLYIQQGSMNAMGATDGTWKRPERLLSAAMLELDPAKLPATLPLDAATPEMTAPARGGVPAHTGTYDPYAPGAPLTLYATGIRNAYDLLWHSNGRLYSGTNGSAAGGNVPATPATMPASCANRPDGGYPGPSAPAITNNQQSETDYVFDVKKGKYYGHPNPLRCEWILNAGNPNGYTGNPLFKVNAYPLGQQADPNYDLAGVYDAGMHASANGTIEYRNTSAFGGAFAGKIVIVRYSANQEVVAFDVAADGSLSRPITGITGFTGFRQPLDVTEHVASGNLYVTELTNDFSQTGIVLLKPKGGTGPAVGSAEVTPRLVFTDVKGGAASTAKTVAIKNTGTGPLTVRSLAVSGADAALFTVTSPALPATVAAGATLTVPVTFAPTVAGPRGATLTVTSDDPASATATTVLRGLGVDGLGGSNEPSLQWILDTLQIPVDVGDADPTNNAMPDTAAAIGDEVLVQSFTKAAFDHVVEVEPISLFGPAGPSANPNVVTVAAHTTGAPAQRTVLFRGPNGANQTVLPAVDQVGQYDLETPFGLDFTWHGLSDRVAYSEDALNTWGGASTHEVRVYPLKNADGTVEPFAYVVAPEDVPSPVDYQDAAVIVRNVKPAATTGGGKAVLSTPELVFSGVKGTTSAAQEVVVTNSGTTDLVISGVEVAGTNAASFTSTGGPQTVVPGGTATFTARFAPSATTVGTQSAVLRLTTDSTTTATAEVGLHGLATNGEQGSNEPPLQQVVDTLGRAVNVGGTGLILGTDPAPIGDEVSAPLFAKAGAGPVTMRPVARYSPDELLPFGWYTTSTGDPLTTEVATIALDQEQTLNPRIVAGGASSFEPGAASFGFYVESKTFGRKSFTQDGLNTGPTRHAVRTYPAKDRAGKAMPNTYLVTFEDAANGDYQDYVFEVTNVRPAGSATGAQVARVNFQPAGASVAPGYTVDSGAAYSATTGSGWVKAGTSTPQDMSTLTRDRAGSTEPRLRTLILMQPTAAQSPNGDGSWEHAVPNGTYAVTVSAGDPGFVDSTHRINVEGQTAIAGFVPTTASHSLSATVTVTVTDGKLTVDPIGGTNTKLQYVDIDRLDAAGDTTAPTVTATVSGLRTATGEYKNEATVVVTAGDTGSGVASTSYSLDGAPFAPYTAPVTVTGTGSHTVRARAQDVAGNIGASTTATFSIVAAGASKAEIVLENADGAPYADRLTMNRIQRPETGTTCKDAAVCDPVTGPFVPANVVHDVATLRVRNTGTEALNVTGLDVTGPFALATPVALPALVAVGGTLEVPVRFTATTLGSAGGLWTGALQVRSDDADEATLPVQLAGFWQSVSEGGQEPDVREMANLFGYTTTITSAGVPLNQNGLVAASGDEVLSPYWLRASTAQPVTVRQLGAFHTQGNTATAFWHAKGATTTTSIVTHAGVEGQSILPHRNGSTTAYAVGTFSPTGAFGFKIDGEWSDPARNSQTADEAAGCPGPCGHHVRFWPVRDRSGTIVANTWLMAMDYSGINYDYNDNVYLVTNVRPETAADPSAPSPLPGAGALQLGFDTTYPGTLLDKDGQTTGFRSTQPNRNDITTGSSSYDASLLDVDTAAPGTLKIASSGTATAGTNAGSDNTLVNGLRTSFDASADAFSVTGSLLGPISVLDAGSEQEAVMFGPDQDNYLKAAVLSKNGVPSVEFFAEQAGVGTTVATAVIPSPAGVSALELALLADPATRTVRAAFRSNDAAWTVLPTPLTLSETSAGRFFDRQAWAGVLVSHKGGVAFTATYDAFAVAAGDVTSDAQPQREALYRLDVAGAGNYTDSSGAVWTPDTGRFSPSTAIDEGASATQEIAGTSDDVLYRTYRGNVGNVPQDQRVLTYALPTRAAGTVDLRLHFAERAAGNNAIGKRVFDIEAEGRVVRSGFDVFAAAGGINTATVLPVNGVAVRDGRLDLAFRASVDYPSIAAIEVLCPGACPVDTTAPAAPTGLTGTAGATGVVLDWADNAETDVLGYDVFRSSSETGTFTKLTASPVQPSTYTDTTAPASSTVFYRVVAVDSSENVSAPSGTTSVVTPAPPVQQPVRINAGGPVQTVGGTTWAACSSLTACSGWVSGGQPYSEADTNTGIPAGMNNTIFQSEWTGGAVRGARAFGFDIPVLNGTYDVRLHFAELNKFAPGTRVFSVDLERTRVLTDFDIYVAAGGANKAIARQYRTAVTDGKVTIDFLANVENAKISAIEVLPADTTAPDAVTGLTGTGTETAARLSWTASTATDVAGYDVYRSSTETGTYTKVNSALVTGTTYEDTTAPVGVASYYAVSAVDGAGNASPRSASVSVTRLADTTAPAVVTGVTATGGSTGNRVAWTASTAADLAGYHVYRAGTRLTSTPLAGTSYDDAAAPVGPSTYTVTAIDRSGNESAASAEVSATRPAPAATAIRVNAGGPAVTTGGVSFGADQYSTGGKTYTNPSVTAIAGTTDDVLYLTERSSTTDLGTFSYNVPVPAGSYDVRLHFAEIYWGATGGGAGGTGKRVFSVNLEGGAVEVANLDLNAVAAPMTAVVRTVRTTVEDGTLNMAFSATVNQPKISAFEILAADTTAPAAVTGLTATGSSSGVALQWAASTATDLAGYSVYRSATETGTFSKVTTGLLTGTSFTDTSAPVGVSHYRVTATDRTGNESVPSATVSATRPEPPDTTAPAVVTGLAATGGQGGNTLTWAASTATDLAGYSVYRSATETGTFTKVSTALITGTTYVDASAPVGTSHYRVTATDRTGNESVQSATVSATRPAADTTAPERVTGLTAAGGPEGIALAWAASPAADLDGYAVYRSAKATGGYARITTTLVRGTSYLDSSTPAGTAYYYYVTAVDLTGNESTKSATVTATRSAAADTTPPDVVTGVTASGAQGGNTVTWTASTATDLAGYTVYRSESATGTFTRLTSSLVSGTTYLDTTAPVGPSSYQVTASDRSGNESGRSAPASTTRPASTQSPVRINAGGQAVTVAGTVWEADRGFTGGRTYSNPKVREIAGTTADSLYLDQRTSAKARGTFSYALPVLNGTYDVRLHFAELVHGATGGTAGGTGQRVFSANLEGGAVELSDLDLNATVAPMTAVVRSYRVTVTDGQVDLAFAATVDSPLVAALEVVPAASDSEAPDVVTGVVGAGGTLGNTVRWSPGAAPDVAGYRVYRAGTAGGTLALVSGTTLVSSGSYLDGSAPRGTSWYRVTAVDAAGNESAPSAEVSATRS